MDEDFKKMVVVRLDKIDENLDRHMKRSDALEAQVEPIHELMTELKGAIRFAKYGGGIILFLIAVAEYLHWTL